MKELDCDHHFYPDQGHGFTGKALEDADQRTIDFLIQPHKTAPEVVHSTADGPGI